MSISANYASSPANSSGLTTTADTSYTQPTNTTVGVVATATTTGTRIDELVNVCTGTSVAGLHRLWLCQGTVGPTIASITFTTTTATVTTATNHGLSTGALVTLQAAFPVDYNVSNVAITVTGLTSFTYTMATTPTANATTVGAYASTPATAIYTLIRETPIQAITGSTTLPAYQYSLNSQLNADIMPIILQPGWSLRTTVSVTQTNGIKTSVVQSGNFS